MYMFPKGRNYDKKIFRIWAILNNLDAGRKVSSRDLAEEFKVSLRTVQRDLELLNMSGFPVISLEKGQHSFAEGFSLQRVMLSGEEASLLSFLYEITKSLGENFEESFRGIFRKVLAKEWGSPFYVKMPEGMKLGKESPFIRDIQSAIEECRKIEMDYEKEGETKQLRIDPLKIMFFDGFWYLLSRVDEKEWIIKLRLENIRNLKVLDDYFEEPENLKTLLDESVNIWFSEKRDKKVVLRVDKDAARYFKQREYFPLQKIKKEKKDGTLVIESMACDYREVIPILLKWIPHVRVMSPKGLKEEVRERVEGYLKGV